MITLCDNIKIMKEPKVNDLKKYLSSLVKLNKKYVTAERLSKVVGIYPEIINENLSYFNPMLMMDPSFNLMELVPAIKKFIVDKEINKTLIAEKKKTVKKKDLIQYSSINDFIYKKMTNNGGLFDHSVNLTDTDLKILKKLVVEEIAKRKKK